MFQSLSQSKVGLFANILKKTVVSGDDTFKYSELSNTQNVLNKNPFLSDIFSVPGLTRLNQIVTGIIGVFLGVCLTFLMGTILIQLLFYKLFAVVSNYHWWSWFLIVSNSFSDCWWFWFLLFLF